MSLILDALNRADQERSEENSTPNIHRRHTPAPKPASHVRRWLIEAAIILLVIAVLIYVRWPQDASTPNDNGAADTTVIQSKAIDTTRNPEISATPPETYSAMDIAAENTTTLVAPLTAPPTALAMPQSLTEIVQDPAISSLYKDKEQIQEKTITTTKAPTAKESIKPSNTIVAAPTSQNITQNILQQIPLLAELPLRFQQSVPNIDYSVHVYSENNGGGFVNLNGSIRKIGAEISPGLRVVAILKDSVVVEYQGNQFRLAALNSWANYN